MKMLITIATVFLSLNCFADGSKSGISGDSYNQVLRFEKNDNSNSLSAESVGQVFYMKKKQAEIEFATNIPGENKVEIKSLRPEEIGSSELMDGLKRSKQSRQWENIKVPTGIELQNNIKNFKNDYQRIHVR